MSEMLEVVDGLVMVATDGNPSKHIGRILLALGEMGRASRVWLTEGLYDVVIELDGVTYGSLLKLVNAIRRHVDALSVDWVVKRQEVYKDVPRVGG